MTDYELADQERQKFYERKLLIKEEIKSITDPEELAKQKKRLGIIEAMYKEALDRMEAARPPDKKKRKAPKQRFVSYSACKNSESKTFDWFEANRVTFADLEGNTLRWEDLDKDADNYQVRMARLMRVLRRARVACTERQQQMLELSMSGKRVSEIAKELGVDKSSVSRTLSRAYQYIRSIEEFERQRHSANANGEESHITLDLSDPDTAKNLLGCLTERQMVYLYLYYGEWLSMEAIGQLLHVDKSTISRTIHRGAMSIQACYPETEQIDILDLSALGDILWELYKQPQAQDMVPQYAKEAAERANISFLQKRPQAPWLVPMSSVNNTYPLCETVPTEQQDSPDNMPPEQAASLRRFCIHSTRIRLVSWAWAQIMSRSAGQSRLLIALQEDCTRIKSWYQSEYTFKRLCSLLSQVCHKINEKTGYALRRLKARSE